MAVEIVILSGSRQGEQLVLEGDEFRVGAEPGCEVSFDPRLDPGTRERSVCFCRMEGGWYVRSVGVGEVLVNQQPVVGLARIRFGDVVRMSDSGPDFSFRAVARTGAVSSSPLHGKPAPPPSYPRASSPPCAPVAPLPPTATLTPAAAASARSETVVQVVTTRAAAAGERARRIGAVVGGVAICVVLLVLGWAVIPRPSADRKVDPSSGSSVQPPLTSGHGNEGSEKNEKEEVKVPPTPPAPDPVRRLKDAVYLIQVQDGERFWPVATACAIGEHTLLTSAREASYLAGWLAKKEFGKVWATNQASGIREQVQEIRVRSEFAALADKPTDWIYFNVAVLTVQGTLPRFATVAPPEETDNLDEGLPLRCVGFTFEEGDRLTSHDRIDPQVTQGKIDLVIKAPPSLPGHPKVLSLKAKVPKSAFGSPIVSEHGKVVGVYGEAAVPPDGQGVKDLHYVTVVAPETIRDWLEKRHTASWVPPAIPQKPSETGKTP